MLNVTTTLEQFKEKIEAEIFDMVREYQIWLLRYEESKKKNKSKNYQVIETDKIIIATKQNLEKEIKKVLLIAALAVCEKSSYEDADKKYKDETFDVLSKKDLRKVNDERDVIIEWANQIYSYRFFGVLETSAEICVPERADWDLLDRLVHDRFSKNNLNHEHKHDPNKQEVPVPKSLRPRGYLPVFLEGTDLEKAKDICRYFPYQNLKDPSELELSYGRKFRRKINEEIHHYCLGIISRAQALANIYTYVFDQRYKIIPTLDNQEEYKVIQKAHDKLLANFEAQIALEAQDTFGIEDSRQLFGFIVMKRIALDEQNASNSHILYHYFIDNLAFKARALERQIKKNNSAVSKGKANEQCNKAEADNNKVKAKLAEAQQAFARFARSDSDDEEARKEQALRLIHEAKDFSEEQLRAAQEKLDTANRKEQISQQLQSNPELKNPMREFEESIETQQLLQQLEELDEQAAKILDALENANAPVDLVMLEIERFNDEVLEAEEQLNILQESEEKDEEQVIAQQRKLQQAQQKLEDARQKFKNLPIQPPPARRPADNYYAHAQKKADLEVDKAKIVLQKTEEQCVQIEKIVEQKESVKELEDSALQACEIAAELSVAALEQARIVRDQKIDEVIEEAPANWQDLEEVGKYIHTSYLDTFDPAIDYHQDFEDLYSDAVRERFLAIQDHLEDKENHIKLERLIRAHTKVEKIHQAMKKAVPNIFNEKQLRSDFLVSQILDSFSKYFIESKCDLHGSRRVTQITNFFRAKEGTDLLTFQYIIDKLAELEQALVDEDAKAWLARSVSHSELFELTYSAIEKIYNYSVDNSDFAEIDAKRIKSLYEKAKTDRATTPDILEQFKAKINKEVCSLLKNYRTCLSNYKEDTDQSQAIIEKKRAVENDIMKVYRIAAIALYEDTTYEVACTNYVNYARKEYSWKNIEELFKINNIELEPNGTVTYGFKASAAVGHYFEGTLNLDELPENFDPNQDELTVKEQLKQIILFKEQNTEDSKIPAILKTANLKWKNLAKEFLDAAEVLSSKNSNIRLEVSPENNAIYSYFDPFQIIQADASAVERCYGDDYIATLNEQNEQIAQGASRLQVLGNIYTKFFELRYGEHSKLNNYGYEIIRETYDHILSHFEARIATEAQVSENKDAQELFGFIMKKRIAQDENNLDLAKFDSTKDYYQDFEGYYSQAVENRYSAITAHIEAPEDSSNLQDLIETHAKVEKIHKTLHTVAPKIFNKQQVNTDFLVSQILDGFAQYFIESKQGREHGSERVKQITQFFKPNEDAEKPTLESIIEKLEKLEQALVDEDAGSWFLRSASRSRLFKLTNSAIEKIYHQYSNVDDDQSTIKRLYDKAREDKEILTSGLKDWIFNHGRGCALSSSSALRA